jgi:hypothetical protein
MGVTTSSMSAEPILAAAAVAGALGYGYMHYVRPAQRSADADDYADASASKVSAAVTSQLHGQKKRGRKLQLPGDATLKNLDVLDTPVHASRSASTSSAAGTRQRQRQHQPTQPQQPHQQQQQREAPAAQFKDVVPGGFDGDVPSTNEAGHVSHQHASQAHSQEQQHQASTTVKKLKKKKGKKAGVVNPSGPSGAGSSSLASSALVEGAAVPASVGKGKKVSASAADTADVHDERWTRVEARKKRVTVLTQDDTGAAASPADITTSDAGITTSVTGNSSPVTERTTEDELPPELDEWVPFRTYSAVDISGNVRAVRVWLFCRSTMEVSAVSLQDAPPRVVPVRPLPGEQPAKGFSWEDYEGVQVDEEEDASGEEEGGWGVVRSRRSEFISP